MVIEGPFGISNFLLPFFFLTIIFGNPNSTGGHVHEKKDEGLGFKIMLIFLNVPHSASFPQARLKIANKQTAIINSIERAVRDVNAEQQSRIGRWAKRGGFGGAVEGQQVPHHSSINAKTKITNTNTGTCPQQKTITTALPVQKVTYN